MTKNFTIRTDDHGYYQQTQNFSPPGPFGFTVDIFATLTLPAQGRVQGTLELDGPPGSSPQSKTFDANSGQKISLGSWYIAHGNNILVVSGQTVPSQANATVTAEIDADLDLF